MHAMHHIPQLTDYPDCPKVKFGSIVAVVSDLKQYGDNAYSFVVRGDQKITITNAKIPDYMANGIKIEIDFDAGTISYTPPKPLAI